MLLAHWLGTFTRRCFRRKRNSRSRFGESTTSSPRRLIQSIEALENRALLTTTSLIGGELQIAVIPSADVDNVVSLSSDASTITITDTGEAIVAGAGFTQVDTNTVTIPVGSVTSAIRINLGDGDDSVTLGSLDIGSAAIRITEETESISISANSIVAASGGIELSPTMDLTVGENATLSTRVITGNDHLNANSTASSGDIDITATAIVLPTGVNLLSHVHEGSGLQAGDITLTAEEDVVVRLADDAPETSINITDATLKGGTITLSASAADRFGILGFKKSAKATITITDSNIEATTLSVTSTSDTSPVAEPDDISTTGTFTFTKSEAGADTITRATGNWVLDGFLPSQSITVQNSMENDGAYVIGSVTPTTITLQPEFDLATETATATIMGSSLMPDPEDLLELVFPFVRSALLSLSDSTADVTIGGSSQITVSGDVQIVAASDSKASPFLPGFGTPLIAQLFGAQKIFKISAVYGQADAIANASIEGSTVVTTGGAFSLDATTETEVTAMSTATSRNTPLGLTFAGGKTFTETDAFTAAGTTVNAGTIDVTSATFNDVAVAAAVLNNGGSGAGLGVALNLLDTNTNAYIAGAATATGDINIIATAETQNFITDVDARQMGSTKDVGTQVSNRLNGFWRSAAAPLAGSSSGGNSVKGNAIKKLFPVIKSGKLNLSGAVSVAITDQNINSYIATGATVNSDGTVSVDADMRDRNNTSAVSQATSDGRAAGGAVAFSQFDNTVNAWIGKDATVNAKRAVNVSSNILIPYPWEFEFTDVDEVIRRLTSGLGTLLFTTFSRNRAAGDKLALSATANIYLGMNKAEAWIDSGGRINTDMDFVAPNQTVNVSARTETNTVNSAGAATGFGFLDKLISNTLSPRINKAASKAGSRLKLPKLEAPQNGFGGAFSFFDFENTARAWIGDGATVKATGDISVDAETEDRLVTMTTASGAVKKIGVNGSGAILQIDSTTEAFIEDGATVTSGEDILVDAHSDPRIYNLTGAVINGGSQVAVGISVGIVDIDSVVRAFIGEEASTTESPTLTFNDTSVSGSPTLTFSDISLTGNPQVTFATDDDDVSTIQRSSGSWASDGFQAGQFITVEDTEENDGVFEIASVSGAVITLADGEELTSESLTSATVKSADTISRSTGSWTADGFETGQAITVAGTSSNNGTYTIDEIDGARLILMPLDELSDETDSSVSLTAPDTITRATGSWISDGFRSGQEITVAGSSLNSGTFTVDTVTGTTLSLIASDSLTDESASSAAVGTDTVAGNGVITAGGDLVINADTGPQIFSATLAGSIATKKDKAMASADSASSPGNGSSSSSGKFSIGASGDISFNDVSTTTRAFTAGDINVVARDVFITSSTTGRPLHEAESDSRIVFATNGSAADSIRRSSGSWLTEGFRPGQSITVSGSTNNNGTYLIGSVTDLAITLTTGSFLTTETSDGAKLTGSAAHSSGPELTFQNGGTKVDTIERSFGSWIAEGFREGQEIIIAGTGSNDGTYTVAAVSHKALELSLFESLTGGFTTQTTSNAFILADDNAKQMLVLAVAGSVSIRLSDKNSVGISGSYADNEINADTRAWIRGAEFDLSGNLSLGAKTAGSLTTIAASGSAAGRAGIAGQVTNNDITNTTFAFIGGNANVDVDGGISIGALDESSIVSISGALAFGGKAGVGASIALNDVTNRTEAFIANATVVADGSVDVLATSEASVTNVTAAIGASRSGMAAAVAVSVSDVDNNTRAYILSSAVTALALNVMAADDSSILVVAGGLGLGKKAGIGASLAINQVSNTTEASATSSTITTSGGDMRIISKSDATVTSITVGGGGAQTFALGGSVSLADVSNTTLAFVNGGTLTTDRTIGVAAYDDASFKLLAGGISGAGKAAIGAAAATTITDNRVEAFVTGATVTARGSGSGVALRTGGLNSQGVPLTSLIRGLGVFAVSREDIVTFAAGGAGAGTVGIAGSASVNVLDETTRAYIENSTINPDIAGASVSQDVHILASDQTKIIGIAGALGGGGTVGVGAAADVAVITKNTEAFVGTNTTVNANGDVIIEANSAEDQASLAASLAAGGTVGIGGAGGVSVLNITTRAFVASAATSSTRATITAQGNVVVHASENTEIDVIGGNAGGAGTASLGAAAGVPIVSKTTEAFIGRNAEVNAKGNRGTSNVFDGTFNVTYATDLGQLLFPQPDGEGGITSPDLEVGAPLSSLTEFSSGIRKLTGSDPLSLLDPSLSKQRVSTPRTHAIQGVSVAAVNRDDIETIGASGGAAGNLAVNLGGSVNVMNVTTTAHIDTGAKVNLDRTGTSSNQDVNVAAGNDYYQMGIAAAASVAAGSASVSVAAGAAVTVATFNTSAFIDDGAEVEASRNVNVTATALEDILSMSAGVAVAASADVAVGVAGSAVVNVINSTTAAFIGNDAASNSSGANVTAGGNVVVAATDTTDIDVISVGAGIGISLVGVGAGLSAGVQQITKNTAASIGNFATVDANANSETVSVFSGEGSTASAKESQRGVAVQAFSDESIFNLVAAGGVGTVAGLAGGVGVTIVESNTNASVGSNAKVNQNASSASALQSVNISAVNDFSSVTIAGAFGAGLGAAGAGVDIGILRNDTTASIGAGAAVSAKQDIDVNALADRDIDTLAISASVGGIAASGSVSVWTIGDEFDSSYSVDGKTENSLSEEDDADPLAAANAATGSDSEDGFGGIVGGHKTGVTFAPGSAVNNSSDTIFVGPSHGLSTGEAIEYQTGGGSAINGLSNGKKYYVIPDGTSRIKLAASRADALSGRAIDIDRSSASGSSHSVTRLVGGGTSSASSSINNSMPSNSVNNAANANDEAAAAGTRAFIASGANVSAGDDVNIRAEESITFNVVVGSATAGGSGFGASIAVITVGANTEAFIDSNATVQSGSGSSDDILVSAKMDQEIDGRTYAGSATGLVSLGAQVLVFNDHSVQTSFIGSGAQIINAGGTVTVEAEADRNIDTQAIGIAISGGVAVGAAVIVADVDGTTQAEIRGSKIGQSGIVRNLKIRADDTTTLKAQSTAANGGIVGAVSGAVAKATIEPTVKTSVLSGSEINLSGDVSVESISTADVDADAIGASAGGLFAAGASVATAEISPTIRTIVSTATITADDVTVRSLHNVSAGGVRLPRGANARALNAGVSLVAGAAGADADAKSTPDLITSVTSNANVSASGSISVISFSGSDVDASTGALGVGAAGFGVGRATAVGGGSTHAGVSSSTLDAAGSIQVISDSFNGSDAKVTAVGGGLVAGFSSNEAVATVNPAINAVINGSSDIEAENQVIVRADSEGEALSETLGASVSLGISVATSKSRATVSPEIDAIVSGIADVNGRNGVQIEAFHNFTSGGFANSREARATANVASGGIAAATGGDVDAVSNASTVVLIGQVATLRSQFGEVSIEARGSNRADADSSSLAGGLIGGGLIFVDAQANGDVRAQMDGSVLAANRLNIAAQNKNVAEADGTATAAGLVAVNYARINAVAAPVSLARVGNGINASNVDVVGDVVITANSSVDADANGSGKSGGLVGGGVVLVSSRVTPTVTSAVGSRATVKSEGGSIELASTHNQSGEQTAAIASAAAGGLAAGVATSGTATSNASVHALAVTGAVLDAGQNIIITARGDNDARAVADGEVIGLVGAGEARGTSNAFGFTNAGLLNVNTVDAGGSISVVAVGSSDGSTTTDASAGGVIGLAGSNSTTIVSPRVSSTISSSGDINADGSITTTASAIGGGSSIADGTAVGLGSSGASRATGQWNPNVTSSIGAGTTLKAGADVNVQAFGNHDELGRINAAKNLRGKATTSGAGAVSTVGTDVGLSTTSTVDASIGAGASVTVGDELNLVARSQNRVDADGFGKVGGLIGIGSTRVVVAMSDNVQARTLNASSSNPTRINGGRDLNVIAAARNSADADVIGGAGGLVGAGSATATVRLNSPLVKAAIGNFTIVESPKAELLVESNLITSFDVTARQTVVGAIAGNFTMTTADIINGQSIADIGNGVTITTRVITISSRSSTDLSSDSQGDVPAQFAGTNTANAILNANVRTLTHVGGSGTGASRTTINSKDGVNIRASADQADTNTRAKASTQGALGSVVSLADNDRIIDVDIDVDAGANINTESLDVVAFAPHLDGDAYSTFAESNAPVLTEVVQEVVSFFVDVGSAIACFFGSCPTEREKREAVRSVTKVLSADKDSQRRGLDRLTSDITFDANVTLGASINPLVEVDSSGTVTKLREATLSDGTRILGIGDTVSTGQLVVSDITNNAKGSVSFEAVNGSVTGDTNWVFNTSFDRVDLINRSTATLSVGNIDTYNKTTDTPSISVMARDGMASLNTNITTNAELAVVLISSSGTGDILLRGDIDNPMGTTTIQATGVGADITSGASGIVSGRVTRLNSSQGQIGTSSRDVTVRLPVSPGMESMLDTVTARNDVFLNIAAMSGEGTPINIDLMDISSTFGNVDINIRDGVSFTPDGRTGNAVDSTANLSNISAVRGNVNITASDARSGKTDIVIDGTITADDTVKLTTTDGGQIFDGSSSIDIVADGAVLNADGGIGTNSDAVNLEVDQFEATAANGDVYVTDSGGLIIGNVSGQNGISAMGTVEVTTSGLLTVSEDVASTGPVSLTATGGGGVIVSTNGSVNSLERTVSITVGGDAIFESGAEIESGVDVAINGSSDILIRSGSIITAEDQIVIKGDDGAANGSGSTVTVSGDLTATAILLSGGADTDTLIIPQSVGGVAGETQWNITAANAGNVGGLYLFSSFENLTGGSQRDVFVYQENFGAVGVTDGQGGTDLLDYSRYTAATGVTVNLTTETNHIGTVRNVERVIGGAGNDSLTGNAADNWMIGGAGNDTITGAGGNSDIHNYGC